MLRFRRAFAEEKPGHKLHDFSPLPGIRPALLMGLDAVTKCAVDARRASRARLSPGAYWKAMMAVMGDAAREYQRVLPTIFITDHTTTIECSP